MIRILLLALAMFAAAPATAETIAANPATLADVLKRVQPGDTIQLARGEYGHVNIVRRNFDKRITINGSGARMTLTLNQSSGFLFRGGTFGPALGAGPNGYAARVIQSRDVTFLQSVFVDSNRAIVIDRSQHVTVNYVRMTGMRIDGINIASSQHVQVLNSVCEKFETGLDHPDCVQLWSRPDTGITSDVLIYRNRSIGDMQGFTAFNHVRNGVDDGGFDRVFIMENYVEASFPQAINVTDCRQCVVRENEAATIPGSRWRASINVVRGVVLEYGNVVGERR